MAPLTRILALALSAVLALQVVNAQGPSDGKYLIVLDASTVPPPFPIGANEQGLTSPVVVGGSNHVWTIKKSGLEEYAILLEEAGSAWFTQAQDNEVFVSRMPPPERWRVQRHEGDTYSIEVPSNIWPGRAWTLDGTQPGTKVALRIFELPRPGQLWKLIPVLDE